MWRINTSMTKTNNVFISVDKPHWIPFGCSFWASHSITEQHLAPGDWGYKCLINLCVKWPLDPSASLLPAIIYFEQYLSFRMPALVRAWTATSISCTGWAKLATEQGAEEQRSRSRPSASSFSDMSTETLITGDRHKGSEAQWNLKGLGPLLLHSQQALIMWP